MRENNFNLIRLLAATLVIISHHFAISGKSEPGFLGLNTIGGFSVSVFFIVSGYLISKSWDRDPNAYTFLKKRIFRIFPGLIFNVILVTFILGALLTTLNLSEYYLNSMTYQYLYNICLYPQYFLPGVFENNIYKGTVNGSIWTLCIEFLMYLYIPIFSFIKGKKFFYLLSFFVFLLCSLFFPSKIPIYYLNINILKVFPLATFFFAGCCFNYFELEKYLNVSVVVFCGMLLILLSTISQPAGEIASYFLLPIIVLGFSLDNWKLPNKIISGNDISYGLYIYAFPIQQILINSLGEGMFSFILVLILTVIFAYLSWRLVERPCLYNRLK